MGIGSAMCDLDRDSTAPRVRVRSDAALLSNFRVFDKDGSGYLSKAEFVEMMADLGYEFGDPLDGQLSAGGELAFGMVDADGNEQISYEEFAQWAQHTHLNSGRGKDLCLMNLIEAWP